MDEEAALIEALNEAFPRWRERFDSPYLAQEELLPGYVSDTALRELGELYFDD